MRVIDADAHVIESEATWDYLAPSDEKYRPVFVKRGEGGATRAGWFIDGKVRGPAASANFLRSKEQLEEQARKTGRNVVYEAGSVDIADLEVRLRHMDEIGVDIQVCHGTLFIDEVSERPEVEVPICRAWNRWMADIWQKGGGRIRYSCVPPLSSMDDAITEVRFAKEHGACAILMRPVEGDKLPHHPYFYPLFEEANRLDLAIAIHIANSNSEMNAFSAANSYVGSSFYKLRLPTVGAFHALAMSEVPDLFPNLRIGFVEASAGWIPYALADMKRRHDFPAGRRTGDVLRESRFYVTCQTDDDIPYLIKQGAEDSLVIGTDFGHVDPSGDMDAFRILREECDISEAQWRKIVAENPAALYGIPS